MARSPLFRSLRRALRLADSTRHTGQSPSEAVERWREAVSRRAFLHASGGAAAGLALGGCATRAPRRATRDEVVIVGAGLAGLMAACRLRAAGVPVRLLEAQNRVGGRMLSLRGRFAEGQVVELGGELIDTGHERLRALCGELGLDLDDLSEQEADLAAETWFFGGQRRSPAEVVEAYRPLADRIAADLATLSGDGDVGYRVPNGAEALDRVSLEEWLDRAGARGWMRSLLRVAFTAEYGLETDRQSALNLLLMIDPKPDPFRVFGESDERFHVRGGNDLVVSTLARRVEAMVETNTVLEAVSLGADGRFRLSVRRGGASRDISAAYVVLTAPFTLLRDVRLDLELPPVKRRAIAELGYGTNAKLMVGFADRVWRTAHRASGSVFADLPFQSAWETSRGQSGRAGVLTNFTGGAAGVALGEGTAEAQADRFGRDLDAIFPGVAAARAGMTQVRFHWPSHPWTRGSYASYLVGQWTTIGGAEGEAVGRLHFAGEHCSRTAQGFMEGACETGESVARAILDQMDIRREPEMKASLHLEDEPALDAAH